MIFDHLTNSSVYEPLHPLFKKAFDYLKQNDLSEIASGKIELDGSKLYISVQEPKGKTPEEAKLETHAKYIDIQYLIKGEEFIGWACAADCKKETAPYNAEKDITFFDDQPTCDIELAPGDFCIFFPGDAHAPCMSSGFIKKAVVKVLI